MPPRNSSTRNRPLASARFASARSVPAMSIPMPANAMVPTSRSAERERARGDDVLHPTAMPVSDDGDRLDDLEHEHVERLGGEQPGARQRRRPEALQHAVVPLVAGGDPEAHHRASAITASESTPGTRKSTGSSSVVFTASTLVKKTSTPSGITERDEEALAAPQREHGLDAGLRAHGGGLHERPSPAVRRRNTSSSERRPARSSPISTCWSRSQR